MYVDYLTHFLSRNVCIYHTLHRCHLPECTLMKDSHSCISLKMTWRNYFNMFNSNLLPITLILTIKGDLNPDILFFLLYFCYQMSFRIIIEKYQQNTCSFPGFHLLTIIVVYLFNFILQKHGARIIFTRMPINLASTFFCQVRQWMNTDCVKLKLKT